MQKNNIFNTTSNQDDTIDKNEPNVPIRKDKILQALENIGQRKISQKAFRGTGAPQMTQGQLFSNKTGYSNFASSGIQFSAQNNDLNAKNKLMHTVKEVYGL